MTTDGRTTWAGLFERASDSDVTVEAICDELEIQRENTPEQTDE